MTCTTCHAPADLTDEAGVAHCRTHQHKAIGTKTALYDEITPDEMPDLVGYLTAGCSR